MNYRHDYHAGNFADVFKHIFLTRILIYLKLKPGGFRMIDTHAGSGLYNLGGSAAAKTGEWLQGICRLLETAFSDQVQALIEPYFAIAKPYLAGKLYPGSPAIARDLLREQDRLILCELHPEAAARLKAFLGHKTKAKLIEIDAYLALKAYVPPIERRGLILIDPPFEQVEEFDALLGAVKRAWSKWPSGLFMIWYPVKDLGRVGALMTGLREHGVKRVLRLELQVKGMDKLGPLARCGLIIINPPFSLEAEAHVLLPALVSSLAEEATGDMLIEWLAGE
jgi:23S rRNA (adenine2030-N6)-methyltransferase